MTPDRLLRIEQLFHAVRESAADERAALLAAADPDVRQEVESLLARQGGGFLNEPAFQRPHVPDEVTVSGVAVGGSLGPYRIEGKLGEGGMGAVYRAIDTRLGRAVAVKVAQERFIQRFDREARAIASLNHPHICTLYDVGPNYLVMELVEGETIAARLKRGAIPVAEALLHVSQILAALAEAHGKGVVHRDLKPGNIMIAKSGIKVLDFGLAKSGHDETLTASGMVMGTPAYMAPEQREGKPADVRSDIYSFGCVFYEMVTGARFGSLRKRLPSRKLERVVGRCLEEDPQRRWQSVSEVERDLATVAAARRRAAPGAAALDSSPGGGAPSRGAVTRADKWTLVLAAFANATGEPRFDLALQQVLALQLEQSRLSLLSEARLRQTLVQMGRSSDAAVTPEMAAEIGERTASAAVVDGSIAHLGHEYVVSVRARNCRTGELLVQEQARARPDDVFKALGRVAKKFATRLAEVLPQVDDEPSLPVEVTTPSLEAWRCYSAAMKALQARAQSTEGLLLLKRATEIEPTFAMAYAQLGRQHADLGEPESGARNIARAYELRDTVGVRENYFITFNYHRQVTRNLELARQTLESWKHQDPGDLYPHGFLSGFASAGLGHYDQAVDEGLKAIAIDPDFSIGYENVAWAYVYLNRPADADAVLRRAADRRIEVIQFSLVRYAMAALTRDQAAMDREATERRSRRQSQGFFEHQEALTLACRGRLKDAARLSERAVSLARLGGLLERAAMFAGAHAAWSALFESGEEAKACADAALSLCRSRDADFGPAFALALLGESAPARQIEADLETRYPQDTSVQFTYLPALRALDAIGRGDAATALAVTQVAAPYDLALPGTAFFTGGFFGALYQVYARGLAYARLGRPGEAAAEFQTILDHPGLVSIDPIGPMARLQLARAHSVSGERAHSAAAYADLLALWKDADPDLPVVMQAIAEYARLQ